MNDTSTVLHETSPPRVRAIYKLFRKKRLKFSIRKITQVEPIDPLPEHYI